MRRITNWLLLLAVEVFFVVAVQLELGGVSYIAMIAVCGVGDMAYLVGKQDGQKECHLPPPAPGHLDSAR